MCCATLSPYATERAKSGSGIPARRKRSSIAVRSESMRSREKVSWRPTVMKACTPASGSDTESAGGAGTGSSPFTWPASER